MDLKAGDRVRWTCPLGMEFRGSFVEWQKGPGGVPTAKVTHDSKMGPCPCGCGPLRTPARADYVKASELVKL
jgi:hypothetical protein